MKKQITSTIFALALGFITGFFFRDYHKKTTETKGQAIGNKDTTIRNDTLQNTLYHLESNWKNPENYEFEDFGPV